MLFTAVQREASVVQVRRGTPLDRYEWSWNWSETTMTWSPLAAADMSLQGLKMATGDLSEVAPFQVHCRTVAWPGLLLLCPTGSTRSAHLKIIYAAQANSTGGPFTSRPI
jgi:hypothetical protein